MSAGEKMTYCMPTWIDSEGGTITATIGSTMPAFSSFNGTCFDF